MGWASCGDDSRGRPIGYAHRGTCDAPGCTHLIDRGLSYACGGMHGEADTYCEGYFCSRHLGCPDIEEEALEALEAEYGAHAVTQLCPECCKAVEAMDLSEFGFERADIDEENY